MHKDLFYKVLHWLVESTPDKVSFGNSNKIEYFYDATGVKLKKQVTENGTVTKTIDYAGNYIYENDELQFFNHPEGYATPVNAADYDSGFDYVYQYKDHLGNIRLSYTDNNGNLEIVEENNYYPFGLEHKGYNNVVSPNTNSVASKFKYNGVELEESLGLNLYEMDFRQYDPAIGRFNVVDAASELARNWTPYRFAFNNPIFFSDPTGLWEKRNGAWYTDDKKDIQRFLNMLGAEQAFNGGVSGAQMDLFIKEEYQGSGGRLSDGSALLDEETIKVNSKTGKSEGFKRSQIRNISRQITKFSMNPYNEKSMGSHGHWAYSYKYYRERNYYSNGGQGMSGATLSGFVLDLTSDYMRNNKFWMGKNFKFYDVKWGGNRYTGGKNKFAGKWSKVLGTGGNLLGVYGIYGTVQDYNSGKLSTLGAGYLGASDAVGLKNVCGSAWSLGTGIGKAIVESDWYFNNVYKDYNW